MPCHQVEECCTEAGVQQIIERVSAKTRVCTTLLARVEQGAGSEATELIDPSDPISSDEAHKLLDAIMEQLPATSSLAMCGTQPPGADRLYEDLLSRIAANPRLEDVLVLLDGFKDVNAALATGR